MCDDGVVFKKKRRTLNVGDTFTFPLFESKKSSTDSNTPIGRANCRLLPRLHEDRYVLCFMAR